LRCATGTSGPPAQIKRKSSANQAQTKRKPSANQRANHFPKDSRYYRNEAQAILPAGASHFASWRKSFSLEALCPKKGVWNFQALKNSSIY